MVKRILVGLGGTEYVISAINEAVALAMAHGAELTGVSVLDERTLTAVGPIPIGGGRYAKELAQSRMIKAEEMIEWSAREFTEACEAAGVRYQILREIGEPFALMTDQARYHDLMIFGLRSLFEFDLVPDPQDALIKLAAAGVRPLIAVSRGFYPVKKVLVAYSGSMESAKAMKRFVQMRLWPDPEMRIVTFEDGGIPAHQLLTDAAAYCRAHGLHVQTECVPGPPREQLLGYAEKWGADLLVMGNSAKNLLLRRILGETALYTIRNANRPLFLAQ